LGWAAEVFDFESKRWRKREAIADFVEVNDAITEDYRKMVAQVGMVAPGGWHGYILSEVLAQRLMGNGNRCAH
jgi:hypothetical protein